MEHKSIESANDATTSKYGTLLLDFSSFAASSPMEDVFVTSDEGWSVSKDLVAVLVAPPRFSGVYLLLVDMFCCDCFRDIGGGQLGRKSIRPATDIYHEINRFLVQLITTNQFLFLIVKFSCITI